MNRLCCNPAHMEPVTQAENVRRYFGKQPRKTHCKHGHPFDGHNGKQQTCSVCKRRYARRYARENREKRRAYGKTYYEANIERLRANARAYYWNGRT